MKIHKRIHTDLTKIGQLKSDHIGYGKFSFNGQTVAQMNRIKEIRKIHGLTLEKLSGAANTTATQLARLEKGERKLTFEWMDRISKGFAAFGHAVRPVDLIEEAAEMLHLHPTTKNIRVIGQVEAGIWREALEWPEDESYTVYYPVENLDYAAHCYGLEVCGDSMNLVYPAGTVLIAMNLAAYPGRLQSGDNVIVRRKMAEIIEATVKELQIRNGKAELWPRSSNPKFKTPISIHWPYADPQQSAIETVEICAIVLGSYKIEKKI